jgi:hypothetical protein
VLEADAAPDLQPFADVAGGRPENHRAHRGVQGIVAVHVARVELGDRLAPELRAHPRRHRGEERRIVAGLADAVDGRHDAAGKGIRGHTPAP